MGPAWLPLTEKELTYQPVHAHSIRWGALRVTKDPILLPEGNTHNDHLRDSTCFFVGSAKPAYAADQILDQLRRLYHR